MGFYLTWLSMVFKGLPYAVTLVILSSESDKAPTVDWPSIMKDRFATFKVEETAFVESLKICNSNDVAIVKIYEAIKDLEDMPKSLIMMYREAAYGDNEKVKRRIKNRMSNIRRNLKYKFLLIEMCDYSIIYYCSEAHVQFVNSLLGYEFNLFWRNNPSLREMDLVHANDYANMSFNQLRNQLQSNRDKDDKIQKAIQYVWICKEYFY